MPTEAAIRTGVEILLVEDNPLDRELTVLALRSANLANEIHCVNDGEEALDFLFCQGFYHKRAVLAPPDLILLDINLPKIDGIEVLQAIRAHVRTITIPVVVLTSSDEEPNLSEARKLRVDAYIRKPIEMQDFTRVVASIGMCYMLVKRRLPDGVVCRR